MNPSPLKLDLAAAQCNSLELHFDVELPEAARRELLALGSREAQEDDRVFFHEDYRQDDQKLHSWGEVRIADTGESDVVIEYLVESELDDQTELHHTDFTLAHLFSALDPVQAKVTAAFTLRFDLGPARAGKFLRLLPYNMGINGGLAVEYRGAHVQVRTPEGDDFDLWYDLRPDDVMEATVRFVMDVRPTEELPGQGLVHGKQALARIVGP